MPVLWAGPMTPWLPLLIPTALAGVLPVEVGFHTLDNGLRIYLAPMDTPGVVSLQTWVDVGSGSEVHAGTTGHAHFLEHLVFTDSADFPATERDQALRTSGAEENAWTWLDDTVYHLTLPSAALPPMLRYDAGRFQRLVLDDSTVLREAGAVQGEWRQGQSDPAEALFEGLFATAFPAHPYGHPTIGTPVDVAAMPQAGPQVRDFMATWYRPETLRVVVAGDFPPEETLALLTSLWGSWQAPDTPLPRIPPEPPQDTPRRVEIPWDTPGANPWVATGWRVPGHDPADPDSAALVILGELLLSDVAGLRRDLIDERTAVHDLGGQDWRFRDPHLFLVWAELKPETHSELVFEAIDAELAVLREGVDPAVLAAIKLRAAKGFRLGLDDPHRLAGVIGQATATDPDPAAIEAWFAALDAVTPDDLARVIATWFVPEGRTQAVLVVEERP